MIEAFLANGDEDNHVYCEGDGEELLEDTLAMISCIYNVLYRSCPHCSEFYKSIMLNPETLQEVFEAVEERPDLFEGIDGDYEDDLYDWEEDFEEDEYPDIVDHTVESFYKRSTKDGFKGGNGLFGFDTEKIKRIKKK